jgi:hypothetical protein
MTPNGQGDTRARDLFLTFPPTKLIQFQVESFLTAILK